MSAARAIRVLVAKPGLDGHDLGARLLCRALMEAGMEVVYTGLRQSPEAIARAAVQESADVVALSILSGAHLPLCRRLAEVWQPRDALWLVGGVIPAGDHAALRALGVDEVFPPATAPERVVEFVRGRLGR